MTDLLFAGGNNTAGLFQVRCAPVVGFSTFPLPAPSGPIQINSNPTFSEGFAWYTIYGTEGTKDYQEEQQNTENGPVWAVKFSLFLPGDSAALRGSLSEMVHHRFVIEVQDNVGIWRRIGTPEQNLELSYQFAINAAAGGRRGYVVAFSGQMTNPPPYVVS
ncbi:hypothetical protein GCM10028805_52120 [Spirosoma harenae]